MSALLDGFRTGFNMMDRYYNNQERIRINNAQLGLQQQRLAIADRESRARLKTQGLNQKILQNDVDRLAITNAQADALQAGALKNQGLNQQILQNDVDRLATTNNQADALHEANLGRANAATASHQATTNLRNYQVDAAKEGERKKLLNDQFVAAVSTGNVQQLNYDDYKDTNLEPLFEPKGREAAKAIKPLLQQGKFKEAIPYANILFERQLNRNVGMMSQDGTPIKAIEIVDFHPTHRGGVLIDVKVTTEKGEYVAPITNFRTANGVEKDPPREYNPEAMMGLGVAMGDMATLMESSGMNDRIQKNANDYVSALNSGGKGSRTTAEYNSLVDLSKRSGTPVIDLWRERHAEAKDMSDAQKVKFSYQMASDMIETMDDYNEEDFDRLRAEILGSLSPKSTGNNNADMKAAFLKFAQSGQKND